MKPSPGVVLWVLMAVLAVLLFCRGHGSSEQGTVAFLRDDAGRTTVRISGSPVKPGIYTFPNGTSIESVTKMTVPGKSLGGNGLKLRERLVRDGDVLVFSKIDAEHLDFSLEKMPAREMAVLGILLDANAMGREDFESLPGIGPALAARIISDRQQNGGFATFRELERVPGIGKKRIKELEPFFIRQPK